MAINKNALIRFRTIDKCLQNKYRKWTLEELMEACSDALHELEGRSINVSKRTVQMDIQMMRSDKLGYNAPIEVYDRKFYHYADEDYSITDIPLNENDMLVLSEAVVMLKQFKDFSLFSELGGIIQRLEDKIHVEKTDEVPIIHLDKNQELKGLKYLDLLYQAIVKKLVLKIAYQSFKARKPATLIIHPALLKEYNNRWFLLCKQHKHQKLLTLALDRVVSLDYDLGVEYEAASIDPDEFYKNTIGVTVLEDSHVMEVELIIDRSNAPYVMTKPFHHSQELLEKRKDGSVHIRLQVHLNYEFERLILGFGDSIEVLTPRILRNRIKQKLQVALQKYTEKPADGSK